MKKTLIILLLALFFLCPALTLAQSGEELSVSEQEVVEPQYFKAKVVEILEEKEIKLQAGETGVQQKLKLIGLEGEYEDQEIIFNGLSEVEVLSSRVYRPGQRVYMLADEFDHFYITDTVRTGYLLLLLIIFIVALVVVARWKGLKSLLVLLLTFLIIIQFILPQILQGRSPVLMAVVGSLFIMILAIYLTEGFNKKSHIAIVTIAIILLFTGLFSAWFTKVTQVTGFSEEALFLMNSGFSNINFYGLILAGIIIGSLGVIDDVVINQVEMVSEFYQHDPQMTALGNYKKSMKVGIAHIGAMVNTLFLAYAGSSILLLILFVADTGTSLSFAHIINQEYVALEIARSLIGSIAIVLSVPLATYLACKFLHPTKNSQDNKKVLD